MGHNSKLFWISLSACLVLAGCGANNTQNLTTQNQLSKTTPLLNQTNLTKEQLKKQQEALQRQTDEAKKQAEADKEEQPKTDAQTAAKTSTGQNIFSEYWLQFFGAFASVIAVVIAISGFSLSGKKKQKMLKKLMHEIDDAYGSFKQKSKRCEAELYRLQDLIEENLKEGHIDENTFQLLEKRIEKYLKEVKEADE